MNETTDPTKIKYAEMQNHGILYLENGLTLEVLKVKYPNVFNATKYNAIIGEDDNGVVWVSGTWYGGIFIGGTFKSGIFHNGAWYDGTFEGGIFLYSNWLNGTWRGGKFVSSRWKYARWNRLTAYRNIRYIVRQSKPYRWAYKICEIIYSEMKTKIRNENEGY